MKNSVKKIIPVLALIVALCCSIAMIAACSSEVVFTGEKEIMSIETTHTLTLNGDGPCDYDVTTDSEMQTAQQIVKSLCKTGTWTFENDVYTVVLGEGDKATTLKSTKDGSTYTIVYSIQGRDGTFDVTLTRK